MLRLSRANATGLARHVAPYLLLPTLLAVGCNRSSSGLHSVTGSVTFAGQPLDQGSIQFFDVEQPAGALAGGMIQNGRYDIPAAHGLKPGEYLVRISSPEATALPAGVDAMTARKSANRERLPEEFNTGSTQKINITAAGPNRFDFVIP